MYCVRCGREVQERDVFCPGCGKPVHEAPPLMPRQSRIAGHVRLLGIFWIAISVFRLLPGLIMLAVFRSGFPFTGEAMPEFVISIIQMIGMAFLAAGAVGIVAGWGLLERRPWARMLAIVLGCVGLLDMPFGTALGIYSLWVLLPAQSEQEYRQIAEAA